MGMAMPFAEDDPFEKKVKSLADDELLEIWVESQQMENILSMRLHAGFVLESSYEEVIVNELFLRVGKRLAQSSSHI